MAVHIIRVILLTNKQILTNNFIMSDTQDTGLQVFQNIYDMSYTEDLQVQKVKLGDVKYFILCAIYSAEQSLKHWEGSVIEYKQKDKLTLEEWAQGKVEGKIEEIESLKNLLKNIERCV